MGTKIAELPVLPIEILPTPNGHEVNTGAYTARFKPSADAPAMVEFETQGKVFTWETADLAFVNEDGLKDYVFTVAAAPAEAAGSVLLYNRSFPDVDDRFTALHDRLKHDVILGACPRLPAPFLNDPAFFAVEGFISVPADVELWANGQLQPAGFTTAGAISFKADGLDLWEIPALTVKDTNGVQGTGRYDVEVTDQGIVLRCLVAYEWLQGAVYPVEIDPTIIGLTTPTLTPFSFVVAPSGRQYLGTTSSSSTYRSRLYYSDDLSVFSLLSDAAFQSVNNNAGLPRMLCDASNNVHYFTGFMDSVGGNDGNVRYSRVKSDGTFSPVNETVAFTNLVWHNPDTSIALTSSRLALVYSAYVSSQSRLYYKESFNWDGVATPTWSAPVTVYSSPDNIDYTQLLAYGDTLYLFYISTGVWYVRTKVASGAWSGATSLAVFSSNRVIFRISSAGVLHAVSSSGAALQNVLRYRTSNDGITWSASVDYTQPYGWGSSSTNFTFGLNGESPEVFFIRARSYWESGIGDWVSTNDREFARWTTLANPTVLRAWSTGGSSIYSVSCYAKAANSKLGYAYVEAGTVYIDYLIFNAAPNAPMILSPVSAAGYTLNVRSQFKATVVDPDVNALTSIELQVAADAAFTAGVQTFAVNGSWASGSTVAITPTADLPTGTRYARARAYDGSVWGGYSATLQLLIKTEAQTWADATATIDPLGPGVKHDWITELRTAVNAARQFRGIAAYTFTDAVLDTTKDIRGTYLRQLREAMAAALTQVGITAVWTDAVITDLVTTGWTPAQIAVSNSDDATDRKGQYWIELREYMKQV